MIAIGCGAWGSSPFTVPFAVLSIMNGVMGEKETKVGREV
jgi:hypothetical protein